MLKILFLLLNAAKLGPLLKVGGTMLLSIGVYAFIFGIWYAVGFVLLLLVHEMGHFVEIRRRAMLALLIVLGLILRAALDALWMR